MLAHSVFSVLFLLFQTNQMPAASNQVFIPTSEAIAIAKKVAKDQGFSLSDHSKYYFDLAVTKDGQPVVPGFITVGFYANSSPVNQISINERTGQIIDSVACTVFDFPDLKAFQQELLRESKATIIPIGELMGSVGCDSFRVLKKPMGPTVVKRKPKSQ